MEYNKVETKKLKRKTYRQKAIPHHIVSPQYPG